MAKSFPRIAQYARMRDADPISVGSLLDPDAVQDNLEAWLADPERELQKLMLSLPRGTRATMMATAPQQSSKTQVATAPKTLMDAAPKQSPKTQMASAPQPPSE